MWNINYILSDNIPFQPFTLFYQVYLTIITWFILILNKISCTCSACFFDPKILKCYKPNKCDQIVCNHIYPHDSKHFWSSLNMIKQSRKRQKNRSCTTNQKPLVGYIFCICVLDSPCTTIVFCITLFLFSNSEITKKCCPNK